MRNLLAATIFAVSVSAGSASAQSDGFFIPDGSKSFPLPPTFGDEQIDFAFNPVARQLAENSASVFLGIDGFLEDLAPYYFNLDTLPDSIEAREFVLRAYTYEYYARLFPEGSEQHRIAENALNGNWEADAFFVAVNAVLADENIKGLYPFDSMFAGIVDSDLLECNDLSNAQIDALRPIVEHHLDGLIYENIIVELTLGMLGQDGVPIAVEFAQSYRSLEETIFDNLENASVGFVVSAPCIDL